MRDGVETRSRPWIADHESQVARFGSGRRPLEVTRRMYGLIVFVNTDQRHIDIESRKIEVVGIPAKKRCLKFGREDEPHVRIFLVTIKIVLAALIKRDDVRTQSRSFG